MPIKSLLPPLAFKQLNQIYKTHTLKSPNPHTLNPLVASLINAHAPQHALLLYNQMLQSPSCYNDFTFNYALKACCLVNSFRKGLEIHAHVVKTGYSSHIFVQNSFIHFYAVQNDIHNACRVFDEIYNPDVVSWTSVVSGLSKCGFGYEAIAWFSIMDVKPNAKTLVTVLSACCNVRALRFGRAVHCYGLRNFKEDNIILDNALLDLYVKCGSLSSARYLFEKMPRRDVVSWSTLVGGFVQRGVCEEAVNVFEEMVRSGEAEPNEATIVSVLAACTSLGSLSLGKQVHSYISTKHDIIRVDDGKVGNALVNMYVKCGDMDTAIDVFNMIKCRDIVSWSTMISGIAMNGHGKQALPLFCLMLVHGICPDDVTFINLLTACSHAGLIEQGLMLYRAMVKVYCIFPRVQHYACVVDMYGRAGLLKEAEGLIRDMDVEADGAIWGALLNACRIHGNENMFEQINRSLPVKGVSVGTFALISNSYANSSRWDEANKVRCEMSSMGMKKMSGRSWIEVGT